MRAVVEMDLDQGFKTFSCGNNFGPSNSHGAPIFLRGIRISITDFDWYRYFLTRQSLLYRYKILLVAINVL